MNISLEKNDAASSGILTMEVVKEDYAGQVEKSLRDLRANAVMPGFRKGHIPMGIIKKMYGKEILAEQLGKMVPDRLYGYIAENRLNILCEPLSREDEQKAIDFDTQEEFTFRFDVALRPEIKIELNKRDKLTYYQLAPAEEEVNAEIELYRSSHGSHEDLESVEDEDNGISGTLTEWENDAPKEGGRVVEYATLTPSVLANEEDKNRFIGATIGSAIVFNPHKAYGDSKMKLAELFHVEKDVADTITGDFAFEVKKINRDTPAEMNQELFDKVFGEGVVTSEEAFRDAIKAQIAAPFTSYSTTKFLMDAQPLLLKKAGDVVLADDLLKKEMLSSDESLTKEKCEEEYPAAKEDLTRRLIWNTIIRANNIVVEKADIVQLAMRETKDQFAQYGMYDVPDYLLDSFGSEMLKKKEAIHELQNRAIFMKLAAWLKEKVKLEVKEVSMDEFISLFKAKEA
ncbi:MAG: trigger factor [Tannerellaceae bacterium]|jgi:trigger factor|nr:trigger factor [Tannerellaceae bacterium]